MAKEQAKAQLITLEGDTLSGTIKVPKSFFKDKWIGYAYVQQKVVFTNEVGLEKIYTPGQVHGFIIFSEDGSSEKFVSAAGGHEVIENRGLNWSGFNDKQFGGTGIEAITNNNYDVAFIRVVEENGFLKRYEYYEDQTKAVPTFDVAMAIPSLTVTHVIRKGDGPFLILNQLKKKRREELVSFLGDCTKLKNVLNAKKLDVFSDLGTIVMTYNHWYSNNHEGESSE